jgi:hypothetical protein
MAEYTTEQLEAMVCECEMHRYSVVHICECGRVISHSQGDWNTHKNHGAMLTTPSYHYQHGDTAKTLFDRLHAYGKLDYGSDAFRKIYDVIAEME